MLAAFEELIEFIVREIPPQKILAFGPSEASRQRACDVISRLKDQTITPEERFELDQYMLLEHMMRLVKARAHQSASK